MKVEKRIKLLVVLGKLILFAERPFILGLFYLFRFIIETYAYLPTHESTLH